MYAVIDIGSNTIRLVVYKIENYEIKPMLNKKYAVGLAGYINKQNRMRKKGVQKAVEVLREFHDIIEQIGIKEVFPFATASFRAIQNREEVLAVLREQCGLDVRVLTGSEEAIFDYYGAVHSMALDSGLLVDIGGGSTELVFYEKKEVVATFSPPVGSLNLYTRFVRNIIPSESERTQMERAVLEQLETVKLPDYPVHAEPICGVGGTARAIQRFLRDMDWMQGQDKAYACEVCKRFISFLEETPSLFTAQLLRTAPDRIHTFVPGIVILKTIGAYYDSCTVFTSRYGVREGYLYYLLEERGELRER